MIFIANVLTMNGGTTFLIRICRELHRRGTMVAVLVLFPLVDTNLRTELARYAKVIDLRDFLWWHGTFFPAQLMTFAPVRWSKLLAALRPYGNIVHVMGVFGLLFACRTTHKLPLLRITAGVYHQNEYLFTAGKSFFIRIFHQCFGSLSPEQILFFNQVNVVNYGKFFRRDFSSSVLAPIGIDLPQNGNYLNRVPETGRLVSVGNLVNFKTYNRHIIGVVAELAKKHVTLRYEIYGKGPEEQALRELVQTLGVQDRVQFHGELSYAQFAETVRNAALFVGSGTALLEAAALGVPALIGVESIQQPETYGFLSDIKGLSYNEFMAEVTRVPMRDVIDHLLSNESMAIMVSEACQRKAAEFSVGATVDGLGTLTRNPMLPSLALTTAHTILLYVSFVCIAVRDRLGLSSTFRNRRDQSFLNS